MGLTQRAIRTAMRVIGPYSRDVSAIGRAKTADDLRRWFASQSPEGFGFNGDVLRAGIVRAAFEAAGCTVFLETGTFRAATTLLAARMLGCPVHTSELNTRSWAISALRCAPLRRVHTWRGDSRAFLRAMASELSPQAVPFVYLDAHWNQDLPLDEELQVVSGAWRRFVVLIDDFQVPERPGFGFDSYGGRPLSLATVRVPVERLASPWGVYFPDYDPGEDTGRRRGFVLIAGGVADRLSGRPFPLTLLRPHDPKPSGAP